MSRLITNIVVAKSVIYRRKETGFFEGGSARVLKFRLADGSVRDYDILSIQTVQFGDDKPMGAPKPTTSCPSAFICLAFESIAKVSEGERAAARREIL